MSPKMYFLHYYFLYYWTTFRVNSHYKGNVQPVRHKQNAAHAVEQKKLLLEISRAKFKVQMKGKNPKMRGQRQ